MKVYLKIKGSMWGSLGLINTSGHLDSNGKLIVTKEHISIFVNRVWNYCKKQSMNWDNLFSHVVSHEYIHRAIRDIAGINATHQYDKLSNNNGHISTDDKLTRTGLNINLEE